VAHYYFPEWKDQLKVKSVGRNLGNRELKGMDKWDEGGMLVMMMLGS
jgi:hypothetical protein